MTRWNALAPLGIAALISACSAPHARQPAPNSDPGAIYEAVVRDALGDMPDALLVIDSTLAYEPKRVWGDTMPERVLALARELQRISAHSGPARELALPHAARFLPRTEAMVLADRGLGGTKVLAVTPIALSPDGREALVYYDVLCGALCGQGASVWLIRRGNGVWRVAKHFVQSFS